MNAVTNLKPKARSRLTAVEPDVVEPKKPKVLVFGPPGVGKTWVSLDFPSVYYFDTEGGADLDHYRSKLKAAGGMYFGPDQGSLDFETVIGQVQALAVEKHSFKTMVFDSASQLFNSAITDESERLGDKDVFGASKKPAVRQMARLIRWVNKADMNAVFICHEKPLWGMENGKREEIGKTFDCHDKLEYLLHFALQIVKLGKGEGAKRFAIVGKSRLLGFPEGSKFDWSFDEFAARYGRDVIEKEVKQVVIASPEQVAEINRLLAIVKLPDGTIEKWFKAASVESFDEMDEDVISKCIESLRGKLS